MTSAQIEGFNRSNSRLLPEVLMRSSVLRVNLNGANLSGADLSEADLKHASLHSANLKSKSSRWFVLFSGLLMSAASLPAEVLYSVTDLGVRSGLASARKSRYAQLQEFRADE